MVATHSDKIAAPTNHPRFPSIVGHYSEADMGGRMTE